MACARAGKWNALDYEAEVAYQFGCADFQGFQFSGLGLRGYGDNKADFGVWGGNLEVGYTFDVTMTPRVFLGGAYFGGEDNRDVNFVEWLAAVGCPFYRPEASVCFNRIASNWRYSEFLDANNDLSNVWIVRGGVSAQVTDQVELKAVLSHFEAVESYAAPWPTFDVLGLRFAPFSFFSFLDKDNSSDLGTEIDLYATYKYSDDLSFRVGYAHLFTGDGLAEGSFSNSNGFAFNGGYQRQGRRLPLLRHEDLVLADWSALHFREPSAQPAEGSRSLSVMPTFRCAFSRRAYARVCCESASLPNSLCFPRGTMVAFVSTEVSQSRASKIGAERRDGCA